MREQEPSRTARRAAAYRAAHQVVDAGRLFVDPLALRILGTDAASVAASVAGEQPYHRAMRWFIAARTRLAEDALREGLARRGVRQVIILGAGLDTFAYRVDPGAGVRIFEVDHPATQAWKRRRLAEAAIAIPNGVVFAPVDFERTALGAGLEAVGFDPELRTFFTWLGVAPYLTEAAIFATLGEIAALPRGAEVVFDYGEPPASLGGERRAVLERRAAQVAELGEPWLSFFEPAVLRTRLGALGFSTIDDAGPRDLMARYLPAAAERTPERGGHVLYASTR